MAGCRSSAPLGSKAQVQLISSSLAQSKCPQHCPTHSSLPEMPLENRTISAEAHPVSVPHSYPPPVAGGSSAGVESRKRPRCSTTNRLPALLHETQTQSCLFRNHRCLLSPRKPSSLKHRNSNYLLTSCLAPLKLCILFSFVRLSTAWLYTELHYDP